MGYSVPPLAELLSPAELESLANECQTNEDIYALLEAWGVPVRREEMQEWALDFIAKQIAFQIQDMNVVRFVIYGPPGKGKSELAQSLAFLTIEVYQEHNVDILGWPKVARSPSNANDIFGEETEKGNTICLILDEKERQSGLASTTNLNALIQNIDTMRVLLHSLIMIAITKQELGKLVSRCQIVFRAIFKDKDNRTNWCIMYVNDMEAKTLLPMAIVGIPMHPHQWFRDWYEKEKRKNQIDLTVAGGRSKADPKRIKDAAREALAFLKKHRIVNPTRGMIKEIMTTEVPNALIGEEMDLTASRVLRLLKEKPPIEPDKDLLAEYVWESDFTWRAEIASLMKNHPTYSKYHLMFLAREVRGLTVYNNSKEFQEVTGKRKTANYTWLKKMDADQSFQGWLKDQRSRLQERYLAQKFASTGWQVEEKPKFIHDGIEYEEDLLIAKDNREIFINAKCGSGQRTYVTSEFKTTHILGNVLEKEAYILYLDLETGIHSIHEPAARVAVGGPVRMPDLLKSADLSTPSLLLRALAGTGDQG